MVSISYTFEGRGIPFTDDTEFQMDGLVRSRNLLQGWDDETLPFPMRDVFEGMGFMEPGFPEMKRKTLLTTQFLENSFDAKGDFGKSTQSTSTVTLNSSREYVARFSTSFIRTNDERFQQTSLKIENWAAPSESNNNPVSVENSLSSAQEPSMSAKRARVANLQSQNPVCLVLGCNKDLSSSKEYHRRHKVCDIHSKTAAVIVNGIQQRFCQQCSRFQVLAEFDDGRRSCRKRLAGHNKRRRKPKLDTHFDSTFLGTDLSRASLLSSKILPGGLFGQLCNKPTNHVNFEEMPSQIYPSAIPMKFVSLLPKSLFHLHEMGKQYPSKNCLNSPLSVLELCSLSSVSSITQLEQFSRYTSEPSSDIQRISPR